MVNTGAAGDRILDISIQSRSISKLLVPTSPVSPDGPAYPSDTSEALQTLIVPTANPIRVSYDLAYRRALAERPGLANLTAFESDYWNDGEGGEAIVTARLETVGPWSLEVLDMKLLRHVCSTVNSHLHQLMISQDGEHARVVEASIDAHVDELFPAGMWAILQMMSIAVILKLTQSIFLVMNSRIYAESHWHRKRNMTMPRDRYRGLVNMKLHGEGQSRNHCFVL